MSTPDRENKFTKLPSQIKNDENIQISKVKSALRNLSREQSDVIDMLVKIIKTYRSDELNTDDNFNARSFIEFLVSNCELILEKLIDDNGYFTNIVNNDDIIKTIDDELDKQNFVIVDKDQITEIQKCLENIDTYVQDAVKQYIRNRKKTTDSSGKTSSERVSNKTVTVQNTQINNTTIDHNIQSIHNINYRYDDTWFIKQQNESYQTYRDNFIKNVEDFISGLKSQKIETRKTPTGYKPAEFSVNNISINLNTESGDNTKSSDSEGMLSLFNVLVLSNIIDIFPQKKYHKKIKNKRSNILNRLYKSSKSLKFVSVMLTNIIGIICPLAIPLMIVGKLVFGLAKVILGVVEMFTKFLFKTLRGVFNVFMSAVGGLYKGIMNYLVKPFLDSFIKFLTTPTGGFIIGYIAGYIYKKLDGEKIGDTLKGLKQAVGNVFDFIGGLLTDVYNFIGEFDFKNVLDRAFGRISDSLVWVFKNLKKTINGMIGAKIGGAIGGLIGGAIGTFFGPAGTFIGTAIGTSLGGMIGKWIGQIPEDSEDEKQSDERKLREQHQKQRQKAHEKYRGFTTRIRQSQVNILTQMSESGGEAGDVRKLQAEIMNASVQATQILNDLTPEQKEYMSDLASFKHMFIYHKDAGTSQKVDIDSKDEYIRSVDQNPDAIKQIYKQTTMLLLQLFNNGQITYDQLKNMVETFLYIKNSKFGFNLSMFSDNKIKDLFDNVKIKYINTSRDELMKDGGVVKHPRVFETSLYDFLKKPELISQKIVNKRGYADVQGFALGYEENKDSISGTGAFNRYSEWHSLGDDKIVNVSMQAADKSSQKSLRKLTEEVHDILKKQDKHIDQSIVADFISTMNTVYGQQQFSKFIARTPEVKDRTYQDQLKAFFDEYSKIALEMTSPDNTTPIDLSTGNHTALDSLRKALAQEKQTLGEMITGVTKQNNNDHDKSAEPVLTDSQKKELLERKYREEKEKFQKHWDEFVKGVIETIEDTPISTTTVNNTIVGDQQQTEQSEPKSHRDTKG